MFFAIISGIACYYALVFTTGVLVNSMAVEGSLITFTALCFIGAYFCRHQKVLRRLCNTLGGGATSLLLGAWFLLPLLTMKWVIIASVLFGVLMYAISRRWMHKRFLRKNSSGVRPAPPFGKEWARWVFAFVI